MPWPQDPLPVPESTLTEHFIDDFPLHREDPFIWAGFAVVAVILLVAILARDPNSGWR